jgi:lipopolysaccharide biosynthesis glycosyltransferase
MNNKIHVVFATDNKFCPYASVAIVSLLENNKNESICVHLFSMNIASENLEKIELMISRYDNAQLEIHSVTNSSFEHFPDPGIYSLACYLRILIPDLLSTVDKALYLDCDLTICGSIRELWNLDISNYSCAAVADAIYSYNATQAYLEYDYFSEGYANSGVLLMNLAYWRKNDIQNKLIDFLNKHSVKYPDQDAINIILHGTIKFIHPKWNCHTGYFAFPPLVRKEQKQYIKSLWKKAIIVHYTGRVKPWFKECVNPYKHHYSKYKQITPWKNTPQKQFEPLVMNRYRIVFLRYCKNFIAKLLSYTY